MHSSESIECKSGLIYNDPGADEQQASLKFDVPGDGSCLFWAVTMAYLIPVKDDYDAFQLRYENMFGNDETAITKFIYVRTLIKTFNPLLHDVPQDDAIAHLVTNIFRNRVVDFIESNLDRFECFSEVADEQYRLNMRDPNTWGGEVEIQAISLILNCRTNVDGQIFPLVTNTKQPNHDCKRLTLKLFNVRAGDTRKANHFNYGLEKRLIEDFCEKQVDNTFKALQKHLRESIEQYVIWQKVKYDSNDPLNNSLENSKESNIKLVLLSVFYFMTDMYYKVMHRISNEVKHEKVCEHKVNKALNKTENVCKLTMQLSSKDSFQKRYTLFPLFKNPKHETVFFEMFKNIIERNKLLKFSLIILKFVVDGLFSNRNFDPVSTGIKEVDSVKDARR